MWEQVEDIGGCSHVWHNRSLKTTTDRRMFTMPEQSTSEFHHPGKQRVEGESRQGADYARSTTDVQLNWRDIGKISFSTK